MPYVLLLLSYYYYYAIFYFVDSLYCSFEYYKSSSLVQNESKEMTNRRLNILIISKLKSSGIDLSLHLKSVGRADRNEEPKHNN